MIWTGVRRFVGTTLITGANGFIGRHVCELLSKAGRPLRRARREPRDGRFDPEGIVNVGEIDGNTQWREVLRDVDAVVHLAARVHVFNEKAVDPLYEFRRTNVEGTVALAKECVSAGVRRFVFVSSVGVNGAFTGGKPFHEEDTPAPHNDYSLSKWEAEQALAAIAANAGLEVVVIRAPLVYGPGDPGNLNRLMQLVQSGIPIPLASVRNKRSLLYVGNFADVVRQCLDFEKAIGGTFLVSDGEDVSTPDLILKIAKYLGKEARLVRFPVTSLHFLSAMAGRGKEFQSLTGSLQVDSSKIRRILRWTPPYGLDEGIRLSCEWLLRQSGSNTTSSRL